MKRLIVCCDGTWNTPDQEENGVPAPTNVFKLFNALAKSDGDIEQRKYYQAGVGSEGGTFDAILGGAIGKGISRNIQDAYQWLGSNYEEGDEIYLFGFSRGAFASRSLGGFLGKGLLDLRDVSYSEAGSRVKKAYEKGYRRKKSSIADWAEPDWLFFNDKKATPIHFVGVWDTVGSLGVPDDLEVLNVLEKKENWRFHNTELGDYVTHARHAMAIDEVRSSFTITRWSNAQTHDGIKELWFPGCHCDVGGGYSVCDLSNGALLWMMNESEGVGLKFRDGVANTIKANPTGVMHNSYKGPFAKMRSRPRNVDAMIPENEALFHASALERQKVSPIDYPAYHPTTVLKSAGDSHIVEIYACKRWNHTGVYLEEGAKYTFSAEGEWQDSKDVCDWKGTEDGNLTTGDIVRGVSSFLGLFEAVFKKRRIMSLQIFSVQKELKSSNGLHWWGPLQMTPGQGRQLKMMAAPFRINMWSW